MAWVPDGDLAYDDWVRHGVRLGVAGRSCGWWIGDWVRYGAARYGQRYAVAARATGYDNQTLMNMVYVARRFEISRRRENLSWSHHAELAALDTEAQERWLDRAGKQKLSVRRLRRDLAFARESPPASSGKHAVPAVIDYADLGPPGPDSAPAPSATGEAYHLVRCPECGHRFGALPAEAEPAALSTPRFT